MQNVRTKRPHAFRQACGLAIIAASIVLLFWSGYHFKIFGSVADPVRYPIQLVFVGCVVLGGFGTGFIGGGPRGGAKSATAVAAVVIAAIIVGQARKLF